LANLFNIALTRNDIDTKKISEKLERAKQLPASQKKTVRVGGGIIQTIAQITEKMNAYLGNHRDEYILLTDPIEIEQYITDSIATGYVAIDTETTGLDTYDDDIVGMSLFSPGMRAAYIPISHISYITNELLPGQVDRGFLKQQLDRYVEAGTKTIWFNADFDIRFIRHTLGVYFKCWFDTSIASRLLNENEPKGKKTLKDLHKKYILHGAEDEFKFSQLFEGICFNLIPIDVGYLYAAKDAKITYELFEFQYQYLNPENQLCIERELQDVANVFWNIEMPCVDVLIDMEDTGVMIDLDVHKQLEAKYLPMMQKAEADFKQRLIEYNIDEQIDIASATQLAHLFYDLLGLVSPDKKKPRGTSKDIIKKLNHPIVDALKDYRAVSTLVNTFIVRLPHDIKKDGKVHCSYKQIGADTGRMACTKPNL
jgi:DNA polymerase-1